MNPFLVFYLVNSIRVGPSAIIMLVTRLTPFPLAESTDFCGGLLSKDT